MTIDLDKIERALEAATRGCECHPGNHFTMLAYNGWCARCQIMAAPLIAHAPEWLRALVDRVRELEAALDASADTMVRGIVGVAERAFADERKRIVALLRERAAVDLDREAETVLLEIADELEQEASE